jgi:hypothetical protein
MSDAMEFPVLTAVNVQNASLLFSRYSTAYCTYDIIVPVYYDRTRACSFSSFSKQLLWNLCWVTHSDAAEAYFGFR